MSTEMPPGKSVFDTPDQRRSLQAEAGSYSLTGTPIGLSTGSLQPHVLPTITLGSVLTFGGNTPNGQIVEAIATPWFRILETFARDPDAIYRIEPRQWEEIIAGAYSAAGFDEVILTPRSGDLGRDVIATRTGVLSIRIIEQVKAYRPGHLVTADEVRAVCGVVAAEPNVSKGVITTTSDFAPRVREDRLMAPLMPHRLELKPKDVLLPWLQSLLDASKGK